MRVLKSEAYALQAIVVWLLLLQGLVYTINEVYLRKICRSQCDGEIKTTAGAKTR
jgi:hypothetical protein